MGSEKPDLGKHRVRGRLTAAGGGPTGDAAQGGKLANSKSWRSEAQNSEYRQHNCITIIKLAKRPDLRIPTTNPGDYGTGWSARPCHKGSPTAVYERIKPTWGAP